MLLFAEKVILTAVVPLLLLVLTNPMNFDRQQQISAVIALLAIGFFTAHSLQKANKQTVVATLSPRSENLQRQIAIECFCPPISTRHI